MNIFKKNNTGLNAFSSFKGTDPSPRLQNTFGEVQTFKRQLIKAEAALKTYAKATEEVLKVTDDSMSAFPRVWRTNDGTGSAASVPEEDVTKDAPTTKHLGAYPSHKHLVKYEAQLSEEVYVPIERWHKQYQAIKKRMAGVEAALGDYDSARKDVAAKRAAEIKHARKTDGRSDAQLQADEAASEAILASKRDAYIELEEGVHSEMLALAHDAQACLGHVTRALQLASRALMCAADDLATKEGAMPTIERQSSGPLALGGGDGTESPSAIGAVHPTKPTGYRPDFEPGFVAERPQAASPPIAATTIKPTGYRPDFVPEDAPATPEQVLPPAPTHTATGVADAATELPSAPNHPAQTLKEKAVARLYAD